MIADHDRSGWFGASDVSHIMGRWDTKTFSKWWLQKIGLNRDHFTNDAMAAGTNYEHAILDAIGAAEKDKQRSYSRFYIHAPSEVQLFFRFA